MGRVEFRSGIVQAVLRIPGGLLLVHLGELVARLVVLVQVVERPAADHAETVILTGLAALVQEGKGLAVLSVLEGANRILRQAPCLRPAGLNALGRGARAGGDLSRRPGGGRAGAS